MRTSEREEQVRYLEDIDATIEELHGQIEALWARVDEKEAERARIVEVLGRDPRPRVVSVEDTQHIPVVAYVPVLVERRRIPAHLFPHLRMEAGRYEAHLLIPDPGVIPPSARAVCGASSRRGPGSQPWQRAMIHPAAAHVTVCRACMQQVEQASQTP